MFTRVFEHLKNQEAKAACMLPKLARYQLRHTSMQHGITGIHYSRYFPVCQVFRGKSSSKTAGADRRFSHTAIRAALLHGFQALQATQAIRTDTLPVEHHDVLIAITENAGRHILFENDAVALHEDLHPIADIDVQILPHFLGEHDTAQFVNALQNSGRFHIMSPFRIQKHRFESRSRYLPVFSSTNYHLYPYYTRYFALCQENSDNFCLFL